MVENGGKLSKKICKSLLVLTFAFILGISSVSNINASTTNENLYTENTIANELNITEEEVINLEENLDKAVKCLPDLEVGETVSVPVSDNLVLEASTSDDGQTINPLLRATYDRTITSTLKLKNMFGGTVVTLNAIGVFRTNGSSSRPIDAYGTHTASVWNVTAKKAVKGGTAYNTYVRNTFSGKFNIGIDPISMTVQTFTYACTTYCNANGKYSASWS